MSKDVPPHLSGANKKLGEEKQEEEEGEAVGGEKVVDQDYANVARTKGEGPGGASSALHPSP